MKVESYAKAGLLLSIASILAGAFVRATGSGDGCGATWPTCKGKIIPYQASERNVFIFGYIVRRGGHFESEVWRLYGRVYPY